MGEVTHDFAEAFTQLTEALRSQATGHKAISFSVDIEKPFTSTFTPVNSVVLKEFAVLVQNEKSLALRLDGRAIYIVVATLLQFPATFILSKVLYFFIDSFATYKDDGKVTTILRKQVAVDSLQNELRTRQKHVFSLLLQRLREFVFDPSKAIQIRRVAAIGIMTLCLRHPEAWRGLMKFQKGETLGRLFRQSTDYAFRMLLADIIRHLRSQNYNMEEIWDTVDDGAMDFPSSQKMQVKNYQWLLDLMSKMDANRAALQSSSRIYLARDFNIPVKKLHSSQSDTVLVLDDAMVFVFVPDQDTKNMTTAMYEIPINGNMTVEVLSDAHVDSTVRVKWKDDSGYCLLRGKKSVVPEMLLQFTMKDVEVDFCEALAAVIERVGSSLPVNAAESQFAVRQETQKLSITFTDAKDETGLSPSAGLVKSGDPPDRFNADKNETAVHPTTVTKGRKEVNRLLEAEFRASQEATDLPDHAASNSKKNSEVLVRDQSQAASSSSPTRRIGKRKRSNSGNIGERAIAKPHVDQTAEEIALTLPLEETNDVDFVSFSASAGRRPKHSTHVRSSDFHQKESQKVTNTSGLGPAASENMPKRKAKPQNKSVSVGANKPIHPLSKPSKNNLQQIKAKANEKIDWDQDLRDDSDPAAPPNSKRKKTSKGRVSVSLKDKTNTTGQQPSQSTSTRKRDAGHSIKKKQASRAERVIAPAVRKQPTRGATSKLTYEESPTSDDDDDDDDDIMGEAISDAEEEEEVFDAKKKEQAKSPRKTELKNLSKASSQQTSSKPQDSIQTTLGFEGEARSTKDDADADADAADIGGNMDVEMGEVRVAVPSSDNEESEEEHTSDASATGLNSKKKSDRMADTDTNDPEEAAFVADSYPKTKPLNPTNEESAVTFEEMLTDIAASNIDSTREGGVQPKQSLFADHRSVPEAVEGIDDLGLPVESAALDIPCVEKFTGQDKCAEILQEPKAQTISPRAVSISDGPEATTCSNNEKHDGGEPRQKMLQGSLVDGVTKPILVSDARDSTTIEPKEMAPETELQEQCQPATTNESHDNLLKSAQKGSIDYMYSALDASHDGNANLVATDICSVEASTQSKELPTASNPWSGPKNLEQSHHKSIVSKNIEVSSPKSTPVTARTEQATFVVDPMSPSANHGEAALPEEVVLRARSRQSEAKRQSQSSLDQVGSPSFQTINKTPRSNPETPAPRVSERSSVIHFEAAGPANQGTSRKSDLNNSKTLCGSPHHPTSTGTAPYSARLRGRDATSTLKQKSPLLSKDRSETKAATKIQPKERQALQEANPLCQGFQPQETPKPSRREISGAASNLPRQFSSKTNVDTAPHVTLLPSDDGNGKRPRSHTHMIPSQSFSTTDAPPRPYESGVETTQQSQQSQQSDKSGQDFQTEPQDLEDEAVALDISDDLENELAYDQGQAAPAISAAPSNPLLATGNGKCEQPSPANAFSSSKSSSVSRDTSESGLQLAINNLQHSQQDRSSHTQESPIDISSTELLTEEESEFEVSQLADEEEFAESRRETRGQGQQMQDFPPSKLYLGPTQREQKKYITFVDANSTEKRVRNPGFETRKSPDSITKRIDEKHPQANQAIMVPRPQYTYEFIFAHNRPGFAHGVKTGGIQELRNHHTVSKELPSHTCIQPACKNVDFAPPHLPTARETQILPIPSITTGNHSAEYAQHKTMQGQIPIEIHQATCGVPELKQPYRIELVKSNLDPPPTHPSASTSFTSTPQPFHRQLDARRSLPSNTGVQSDSEDQTLSNNNSEVGETTPVNGLFLSYDEAQSSSQESFGEVSEDSETESNINWPRERATSDRMLLALQQDLHQTLKVAAGKIIVHIEKEEAATNRIFQQYVQGCSELFRELENNVNERLERNAKKLSTSLKQSQGLFTRASQIINQLPGNSAQSIRRKEVSHTENRKDKRTGPPEIAWPSQVLRAS